MKEECRKCGSKEVKVEYVEARFCVNLTIDEYLKLTCTVCGYCWKVDTMENRK